MIWRLLEIASSPVRLGDVDIAVSASIGVTFCSSDVDDGDTLLRQADQAMYTAKQGGKNRFHLYERKHDQGV